MGRRLRRVVLAASLIGLLSIVARTTPGDAAALQARIDACPDTGCLVTMDAGQYLFESTVTVPTRVDVRGSGPSTQITVAGSHCAFSLVGSLSSVRAMVIDGQQATPGCGVDFADAETNDHVSDLGFGHYLAVGLRIAPTVDNRSIFTARNLRWNGVLGNGTAVQIGDGVHHVSDILLDNVSGTAHTSADMGVWIDVRPNTDTVQLSQITLIKATWGIRVGYGASEPSAVTGFTLHDAPAIEGMSDYGVSLMSVMNARIHNISSGANHGGVSVYGGVRSAIISGSLLYSNRRDGLTIFTGAQDVIATDNVIADNNTDGAYWGFGVSIGSGVSDFTIANNHVGNGQTWNNGQQRYGIFLAAGASDRYSIIGNALRGNTVSDAVVDGGTGTRKVVALNY